MSFRAWLSIVTFVLIGVILYFSREELVRSFELLFQVNIWILLLLIPVQILVYYAAGEMVFSYLRGKGSIDNVKKPTLARISLEMNFVNHVLPSGGVSGVSYMTWRLKKLGISSSRATIAQVVRFAVGFIAYIVLLLVAVLMVTIDGEINRWIILVSSTLVGVMISGILAAIYLFSSIRRMNKFAAWLTKFTNKLVKRVTFGKKTGVLSGEEVNTFFEEMHHDYAALKREKRILIKPFWWGIVFTIADVSLFLITFWALGNPVNPAPVLIAYGIAAMAGFFVITPGGAGAYEAIMVAFLAIAGLSQGTAIAGIVLTRIILLIGTIALGYVFYQLALIKYGKKTPTGYQR